MLPVLIETLWNVNKGWAIVPNSVKCVLIETLWNVNFIREGILFPEDGY